MTTDDTGREAISSLRSIPLFSGVGTDDLNSIAQLLIERRFPKHKTIVEEGMPGDYMYVIVDGRVKVSKLSGDGREKIEGTKSTTQRARLSTTLATANTSCIEPVIVSVGIFMAAAPIWTTWRPTTTDSF